MEDLLERGLDELSQAQLDAHIHTCEKAMHQCFLACMDEIVAGKKERLSSDSPLFTGERIRYVRDALARARIPFHVSIGAHANASGRWA